MHYNLTRDPTFNGLPINSIKHPCRQDILQCLYDRFRDALDHSRRVFFIRFDLHFPINYITDNPDKLFRDFMLDFSRNRRSYGLLHYIWRKHQESSIYPHYHIVLLFDFDKTRSINTPLKEAERRWGKHLGIPNAQGLVDWCLPRQQGHLPNGVMMDRNSSSFHLYVQHCFHWASYLAQERPGNMPLNSHGFSGSQIVVNLEDLNSISPETQNII